MLDYSPPLNSYGIGGPVVALVGCGSAKHPGLLPAGAKYSSNYAGLKRDYAQEIADHWAIVSAKHHVVEPHEWIDDYDESIRDKSPSDRALWGEITGTNLVSYLQDIEQHAGYPREVHLLLGKAYREPISDQLRFLRESTKVDVIDPFEGTSGIGEQMSELKTAVQEATE